MKASKLKLGTGAIKPVEFTTLAGETARLGLRVVLAADEALAIERATEFAAERGAKEPRDGHPLYELGKAVHLVAIAAVDLDAPAELFFDGGAKQVVETLDTERIFLLREKQRIHQDEAAPSAGKMGASEFIAAVFATAEAEEGAELPFESWPLVLRRSWVRTLASLYAASLSGKSPTGQASEPSSTDSRGLT